MLNNILMERGAKIGDGVFFGTTVYIDPGFERFLEIEDGAVISQGVTILLHDSSLNNISGLPIKVGKVRICRHAFIGANTTILCGVKIGENSLVGAGSLVTKNIPSNTVAYGVPAATICSISEFKETYIKKMANSNYYFWDVVPWRARQEKLTSLEEQDLFLDFIYTIKDRLFTDAPDCLDFSNKLVSRYLLSGWHGEENWPPVIRWTGKKATAYLKTDSNSKNLFIKAFTSYGGMQGQILIEKKHVQTFDIQDSDWKLLETEIPDFCKNKIIEITIELDNTWIPDEVMKNGDTRELGIAVQKIWIE